MKTRNLIDLVSVGPATVRDLKLVGVTSINQLKGKSARGLYNKLNKVTGVRHDPCCEDVFAAAIAQAKNPYLAPEKRKWWYWSKVRKNSESKLD